MIQMMLISTVANLVFVVVPVLFVLWILKRKSRAAGHGSIGELLRAVPHTDPERRAAVDLVLTGLVLCVLGILFAPFVLVGVVPLYYGARKLAYASLGLGLVDDGEVTGA